MRTATYLLLIVMLMACSTSVCAMTRAQKAFSSDGSRAVVSGKDGALILWDTVTKKKMSTLHEPRRWERAKPKIVRFVKLWDIERGKELVTLEGHGASFSPDGNFLSVTNPGHPDTLWDIRKGKMHFLDKKHNPVQQQSK